MGLKTSLKSMNAGVLSAVHRGPARLVNEGLTLVICSAAVLPSALNVRPVDGTG